MVEHNQFIIKLNYKLLFAVQTVEMIIKMIRIFAACTNDLGKQLLASRTR